MTRPRRSALLGCCAVLLAAGVLVYSRPLWVIDHLVRLNLWRTGVESRYVAVNGEQIHYLEARSHTSATATPIVLVHGLGARAEDWSPIITGLAARGFHVYAIDLLGYGRSARPADASFSIAQEEQVVKGFMETLGIGHADVAGWSMGGWVAMKFAIEQPKMVDRLVLYDSAGIYFPLEAPSTLFRPENPAQFRRLAAMLTPAPMPDFFVKDELRRFRQNSWIIERSVASMTSGADLLNFRLGQLRRPTLIVWGAEDALIPPSVGEELHADIAGSSLTMLDGCGHLAPAQCARPALAATVKFLRGRPATSEAAASSTVATR